MATSLATRRTGTAETQPEPTMSASPTAACRPSSTPWTTTAATEPPWSTRAAGRRRPRLRPSLSTSRQSTVEEEEASPLTSPARPSLTSVQHTTLLTTTRPLHLHHLHHHLHHLHLHQVPPLACCRPTPPFSLTTFPCGQTTPSQPSQLTSSFLRQLPC